MYWVNEKFALRMINIANNLGNIGKEKYGKEIFLVNYRNIKLNKLTSDELFNEIKELRSEIIDLEEYPREYLEGKLTAFEYLLRYILGEKFEYAVLLEKIQQLPCEEIPKEEIKFLTNQAIEFLNELGYKGSLKEMKEQWYSENYLDRDEVIIYAQKFIKALKEVTLEKVVKLHPDDEINAVKGITGVFWSGFSKYPGDYKGNLTFNIDKKWNKFEFVHVLAHESYPGHQAFYSRWDYLLNQDCFPMEAAYYLLNEPINTLFEGGPENAIKFIDWENDKINTIMNKEEVIALKGIRILMKLTRIYQTNASYYYNTGKMNKKECIEYMVNEGMMNQLDATNTYRFFSDILSVTTYPTYYYGRKIIEDAYDSVPKDKIIDFFEILYDQPHTNNTFKKAMIKLLNEGRIK